MKTKLVCGKCGELFTVSTHQRKKAQQLLAAGQPLLCPGCRHPSHQGIDKHQWTRNKEALASHVMSQVRPTGNYRRLKGMGDGPSQLHQK